MIFKKQALQLELLSINLKKITLKRIQIQKRNPGNQTRPK